MQTKFRFSFEGLQVTFGFYFGLLYWAVSMGTFIFIKGSAGDEISTFPAILVSALWPLTFFAAITIFLLDYINERRVK